MKKFLSSLLLTFLCIGFYSPTNAQESDMPICYATTIDETAACKDGQPFAFAVNNLPDAVLIWIKPSLLLAMFCDLKYPYYIGPSMLEGITCIFKRKPNTEKFISQAKANAAAAEAE